MLTGYIYTYNLYLSYSKLKSLESRSRVSPLYRRADCDIKGFDVEFVDWYRDFTNIIRNFVCEFFLLSPLLFSSLFWRDQFIEVCRDEKWNIGAIIPNLLWYATPISLYP